MLCNLEDENTSHLFADGRHPDSKAHSYIARLMLQSLAAPQAAAKMSRSMHTLGLRDLDALVQRPLYTVVREPGEVAWFIEGDLYQNQHSPWGMLGFEYRPSKAWLFGGALSRARQHARDDLGRLRHQRWGLGGYAAWFRGSWHIQGSVGAGLSDLEHTRTGVVASRDPKGESRGQSLGVNLSIRHDLHKGPWRWVPSLGVGHLRSWVAAFRDQTTNSKHDFSGLQFARQHAHQTYADLGVRTYYKGHAKVRPFVDLGYRKVWSDAFDVTATRQAFFLSERVQLTQRSGLRGTLGIEADMALGRVHLQWDQARKHRGLSAGWSHRF